MQLEQKLENGEEQCENISIISMSAEEVLSKIKEKKEMEKNNTTESGLR